MLKNIFTSISSSTVKATQLCTFLAAALSTWVMVIQHGRIKDDSVLYLEIAKLFTQGHWNEGLALYKWSFYPLLIAITHHLTTLPLVVSAQLLQIIFFTIFTYSFLRLIRLADGNVLTVFVGALLVFSSPSIVGVSLELLLRDFGFYAFLFLSLVFLIEFNRTKQLSYSLLWQISIITAMLFRVEGFIYLLMLPLTLLFAQNTSIKTKLFNLLKINALVSVIAILFIALLTSKPNVELGRLSEIIDFFNGGMLAIYQTLNLKAQAISTQILGNHLDEYGLFSIILTLFGITLIKLSSVADLAPVATLIIYGKNALKLPSADVRHVMFLMAIIASINALFIIFSNYVLEVRYILPFGVLVLFFSTFSLTKLIENYRKNKHTPLHSSFLLMLILALSFYHLYANIKTKRADYNYDQDAVAWVNAHKASNQRVFYNSERLKHYGNAPFYLHGFDDYQYITESINNQSIFQYDYLVLSIKQSQVDELVKMFAALPQYTLLHEVSGYEGKKKILIFKKTT